MNFKKIIVGAILAMSALFAEQAISQKLADLDKPKVTKELTNALKSQELDQVKQVIENKDLKSKVTYATTLTDESFIQAADSSIKSPSELMIVSYFENGAQHYALVDGVDIQNGKVLLVNFGTQDSKPVWVDANSILADMKALNKDHCTSGYITVSALPQSE